MSTPTVNVTLNSFDAEGNQVDTDNMDLAHHQVSDIVDHAAQSGNLVTANVEEQ